MSIQILFTLSEVRNSPVEDNVFPNDGCYHGEWCPLEVQRTDLVLEVVCSPRQIEISEHLQSLVAFLAVKEFQTASHFDLLVMAVAVDVLHVNRQVDPALAASQILDLIG
jgi:hypothetical protein